MIEGIVFDMDGVLIDSHGVHRLAWSKFLASVGRTVTDRDLDFILEGRRRDDILRHFLGDLTESEIERYGRLKGQFSEENFKDVKLMPGVREFIAELAPRGLKTGLATSAGLSRTWGTLGRFGLEDKFNAVATADEVSSGKPDPAVYYLVSSRMGIAPENILVIEDAANGILAAKSAGMRCVGLSSNDRSDVLLESGAECIIPDFHEHSVTKLLRLVSSQPSAVTL